MTSIYIIDDYTSKPIWDDIRARTGELPTSPKTDDGSQFPTSDKPEGEWSYHYVMHQHASVGAYSAARIRQPAFEELPCIFAVQEPADGSRTIRECIHAEDADKSLAFIASVLATAQSSTRTRKAMTPEQQRIAIAEACGWTECQLTWHPMDAEGRRGKLWLGIAPINKGKSFEVACWTIPDYPGSLDAMHEAEKMLSDTDAEIGSRWRFIQELIEVTGAESMEAHRQVFVVASATAAQRAEAFLRTIGKWTE